MTTVRRTFLKNTAAAAVAAALPSINFAQAPASQRAFAPKAGTWRTFDVTTRIDVVKPEGVTRVWVPVPSVNSDYQHSMGNSFSSNGTTLLTQDGKEGVKMLYVEFPATEKKPYVEITSRVQTQSRSVDWSKKTAQTESADTLSYFTQPTRLIPTDGIVLKTALAAIGDAKTDVEKTRRIYEWVVSNTFREPKVRGCGEGDIKVMLETGNLGGKCADLNAIFVGMNRAVGIPARDVYGVRLVPSAFGYKELGANPASLKGAQHCRSEVFLKGYGWVAMDPADVAKVMRQETPEWIKTVDNPVVAPVHKALFGSWEGNWMAYNTAHDVVLPGSAGDKMNFLMYPIGETASGRIDCYAPDDFKYQITATEVKTLA